MKKLLIIPIIFLLSCDSYSPKMRVVAFHDKDTYSSFTCDSATMLSNKEVIYWKSGYQGRAIADNYITLQNP